MTDITVNLAWVLDRIVLQAAKDVTGLSTNFFASVVTQMQRLCSGEWFFQLGRYGNLSAAAAIIRVGNSDLKRVLADGVSLSINMACLPTPTNQPCQIVLMDLWCEAGQGKAFLHKLRDQLKPQHESIIYFRIKNGKRIAKMLTRDDATTFMRSSQAVQVEDAPAFLQTAAARDFYLPTYNTQMAFAQRVGEMALLMVHAPVVAVSPLKPVLERIQTCARLAQHKIYETANGTQTGLVTWAWLTAKRLRADAFDTNALQAFEWSEGQHLAVVDVVMNDETQAAVWADLAGQLYPDEDIWLLCRVQERTFFKKWSKNQRQELLTNAQARSAVVFGKWHDMAGELSCGP